ncbi:hypothetical protein Tco_0974225 [Tanacetum coccineum]|uniref:N-acetyltransferase domain-containing protein n=1 Tax=Tanacetum coccineum TaxID=301880 RepID=A0ABQ5EB78_9ASTR
MQSQSLRDMWKISSRNSKSPSDIVAWLQSFYMYFLNIMMNIECLCGNRLCGQPIDKHSLTIIARVDQLVITLPFGYRGQGHGVIQYGMAYMIVSYRHRVEAWNVMTPRSTNIVFNRIGFAIQKGLAAQLVARLPSPTIECSIRMIPPGFDGISLKVSCKGCFTHRPLKYQEGVVIDLATRRMAYEEFTEVLEKTIGINFQDDMKLGQYLVAADTTIMDACVAKWRELPKPRRFCNDFSVDELVNRAKNKVHQDEAGEENWATNEVEYDEEAVQTQQQIEIDLTPLERASQDEADEDNWATNEVKYDEEAVQTQQQIEIDLTPLERASQDEAGEDN